MYSQPVRYSQLRLLIAIIAIVWIVGGTLLIFLGGLRLSTGQDAGMWLLIVGGDDWNVLELNDEAATQLRCPHELAVVPHAGHLFEEPGALERVTELAANWFATYLGRTAERDAA